MDPDDAERIYTEQRALMLATAVNHVGRGLAEDVVQDAAVKMLGGASQPIRDDRAFAFTVADRAAHEHMAHETAQRRDVRRTEPLDLQVPAHHAPSVGAEQVALSRLELRQALQEAPRSAVQNALGYTVREIAQRQGRRVQSVTDELWRWESRHRE